MSEQNYDYEFHPLTPERWSDLEKLFGERGATGGCWCMWWRMKQSDFDAQKGDGNRTLFRGIVDSKALPGILAYVDAEPAGWCAIAPRAEYSRLERSRIFKPVDENPVWSVTCFFVAKPYRKQGLTVKLLQAAVDFAAEQGAQIVEGYPVEPKDENAVDVFVFPGLASAFRQAGFVEVERRSETRPMMRYYIGDKN